MDHQAVFSGREATVTAPATADELLALVKKSGVVPPERVDAFVEQRRAAEDLPAQPQALADALVRDGLLTRFQAEQLLRGDDRLNIGGKYNVLDLLGVGGMGSVYLCEHKVMNRQVAVKVLPNTHAKDSSSLERFYREARAVARLNDPNIVRAFDIDHEGDVHFLVMEYVAGSSLLEIIKSRGPMDVARAAHYIRQAAWGLHHANEHGIVHRDIKPGNLLLDHSGVVKILDMGLARLFTDTADNLTQKYDETLLGTADYMAPEQAIQTSVDIRADIYGLGATFYFLLTGSNPLGEGNIAQKLVRLQLQKPEPLRNLRPAVPEELAAIVEKMMAKDPAQRYQLPAEVVEALAPWTTIPIAPPPDEEMPHRLRAKGAGSGATSAEVSTALSRAAFSSTAIGPQRRATTSLLTPLPAPSSKSGVSRSPFLRPVVIASLLLAVAVVGAGFWGISRLGETSVVDSQPPIPIDSTAENENREPLVPPAPIPVAAAQGVSIRANNNEYRIHTPAYDAVVEADGCLTSLRVGGVEFLQPKVEISRGAYLYQQPVQALKLTDITQPLPNVIVAKSELASIRYEFGTDTIRLKLENDTGALMPYYALFSTAVTAMQEQDGSIVKLPVNERDGMNRRLRTCTWFAGPSKLTMTGGDGVWGKWKQQYLVWFANLSPHASRYVEFKMDSISATESREVAAVTGAAPVPVPPSPVPVPPMPELAVPSENARRIRTTAYEAVVETDGNLTSLKVGGVEFLYTGGPIARGAYLFDKDGEKKTIVMPEVDRPADSVITAKGLKSSVRYEFGETTVTVTLTNLLDRSLVYYIVFFPQVNAVMNDQGEIVKSPADRSWSTMAMIAGRERLKITGGSRIFIWDNGMQVWETYLKPHDQRQIVMETGVTTDAEAARISEVTGTALPSPGANIPHDSPQDYQVFQRHSRLGGDVVFHGHAPADADVLEVRLTGESLEGPLPGQWQALPLDDQHGYESTLPTASGGWYQVEIRALNGEQELTHATVNHVGVGEVFVGAGQSNSTNYGEERLQPASGMVSAFSGQHWQPADDPQPGANDTSSGGSFWPAFGDAMYERYQVPIGVTVTGRGGTSVKSWQPGGELFQGMMSRIERLGPQGFRAVLWHQGEADAEISTEDYVPLLTQVIKASTNEAGWEFPWFVAQVSYTPDRHSSPGVRAAQQQLWDSGIALEGPDTDALTGVNRDHGGSGIHFSGTGLRAHGKLWAEKVSAYLEKVLREEDVARQHSVAP